MTRRTTTHTQAAAHSSQHQRRQILEQIREKENPINIKRVCVTTTTILYNNNESSTSTTPT